MKRSMMLMAMGALVGVTIAMTPDIAMAGTGGVALNPVWTQIVSLTQGTLGRIIVILIVVGGIAAAVVRQSLWAFIIGLSAGIGLYNTPTIVQSIMAGVI